MKKIRFCLPFLSALLFSSACFAAVSSASELASEAASDDVSAAATAITELRAMGPVGLDALFVKYAAEIDRYDKTGETTESWRRVANALDSVAMQKDAYTSHLYWYTDLNEAMRVAKARNKPILTLRLLGNLNEEFSCANSRLFRAILYSNTDVAKYLRDNYILHWKSVRPAPRITIDFGDGRKIERTITGNSIHYVLNSDGTVIDAIPGLYRPTAFLKYVRQANEANKIIQVLSPEQQTKALLKFRQANFKEIVDERNKAIQSTGVEMTDTKTGTLAILAAPMAMAKAIVVDEYSILRVYDDFAKFEPSVKYEDWNKLAAAYSPMQKLDANSIAMVRRQNAKTGLSEAEFGALFTKLDSFIALDTTRNDFLFHTKLYEWLNRDRPGNLETLNALVYDKIFQTPNTDKWLGLYSNDVYTALDGNGVIK
ncbi:hypothetical protein BH10ACI2_BH10ACI2_08530 [soil metagenome]